MENSAKPRYITRRRPDRPSRGDRVSKVADALKQPLLRWQYEFAQIFGEYNPKTGVPYYREGVITVPRQSGKTTIILAEECDRCLNWGPAQNVVYTAQTGWDAHEKLIEDQVPLLEQSQLWPAITKVRKAAASEAIYWRNRSALRIQSSTESAGHGRTRNMAVIDEAFADQDGRREQSLLPAMATVADAQILIASTAGTPESVYFKDKLETARTAVEEDYDSGICLIEYSASDDQDIFDPREWESFMPALHVLIKPSVVAHAAQTMKPGEFERAWGNRWNEGDEYLIAPDLWLSIQDSSAAPIGSLAFGLDATLDRRFVTLAATGSRVVEVVHKFDGTSDVVDEVASTVKKHGGHVVIDLGGPAGNFAADLEREGVQVVGVSVRELGQASAGFYDAVINGTIAVRTDPSLNAAIDRATKRTVGDTWVFRRSDVVDSSPILAVALSLWGDMNRPEPPDTTKTPRVY